MGRVHKKKLAEYAEAAENDDNQKGVGEAEEDEEEGKSATAGEDLRYSGESDVEELANNSKNDSKEDEQAVDGTNEGNDEAFQSAEGDQDTETSEKNGAGKKGTKRKSGQNAAKKIAEVGEDDDGSDGEPLNGGGAAKKGRKAAAAAKGKGKAVKVASGGGRGKAKAPKKAAVVSENEEDEEEEEYEVKDIIKHKVERGQTLFLIRWKGYTKDDDTWEPEETLSCPDIIKKYKEKNGINGNKASGKKNAAPAKKAGRPGGGAVKALKADPNKEWEVDKIIDYAIEKAGRVFRIRWKGFSPKYDTWEPEKNLYCEDLIEKFMERMDSQENMSFKELRVETKKPKRLVNETAPRTNYRNPVGRKSKRAVTKKRVYYGGDSDE